MKAKQKKNENIIENNSVSITLEEFIANNSAIRKHGTGLVSVFPKWYMKEYGRKERRNEEEWVKIFLKFVNS